MVGRGCNNLMEKLLAIQVHFCDMLESCNGNFGLKTFAETEPHMETEKCRHPHFEMMHLPVKKRMYLHARLLCNYTYSLLFPALLKCLSLLVYSLPLLYHHLSHSEYHIHLTPTKVTNGEKHPIYCSFYLGIHWFILICALTRYWTYNLGINKALTNCATRATPFLFLSSPWLTQTWIAICLPGHTHS